MLISNSALLGARAARSAMSDADFITWANAPVFTPRMYFASYRTFEAVLGTVKVDAIQAAVKQMKPRWDDMLSAPGDEKGSGGGIDISRDDVRQAIAGLVQAGVVTQDDANQILALGGTTAPPCRTWGFTSIDAGTLTAAHADAQKDADIATARTQLAALKTAVAARQTHAAGALTSLAASLAAGTLVTIPTVDAILAA